MGVGTGRQFDFLLSVEMPPVGLDLSANLVENVTSDSSVSVLLLVERVNRRLADSRENGVDGLKF